MPTHIAVITRDAKNYKAVFPDFPDLEAESGSLDGLRTEAQGRLEEHLATAAYDESHTRKALTLDEVAAQYSKKSTDIILLALSAQSPASKAVRINITIPENLLQAVDRSAEAHSMSRSRFLARAVEAVVTGKRHQGIQIPLRDEVLATLDKAAEAHKMNRIPFLTGLIEVSLGLRRGHHSGIRLQLKDDLAEALEIGAKAHNMDRQDFIASLLEVGLGLKKGHGKHKH